MVIESVVQTLPIITHTLQMWKQMPQEENKPRVKQLLGSTAGYSPGFQPPHQLLGRGGSPLGFPQAACTSVFRSPPTHWAASLKGELGSVSCLRGDSLIPISFISGKFGENAPVLEMAMSVGASCPSSVLRALVRVYFPRQKVLCGTSRPLVLFLGR